MPIFLQPSSFIFFTSALLLTIAGGCSSTPHLNPQQPPIPARAFNSTDSLDNKEVLTYLKAEADYGGLVRAALKNESQSIYRKLRELKINAPILPSYVYENYYFTLTDDTQKFPIFYRSKTWPPTNPVKIFDPNLVSITYPAAELSQVRFSPSGDRIAFLLAKEASISPSLFIYDINSRLFYELLSNVSSFEFGLKDNSAFVVQQSAGSSTEVRKVKIDFGQNVAPAISDSATIFSHADSKYTLSLISSSRAKELKIILRSLSHTKIYSVPIDYSNTESPFLEISDDGIWQPLNTPLNNTSGKFYQVNYLGDSARTDIMRLEGSKVISVWSSQKEPLTKINEVVSFGSNFFVSISKYGVPEVLILDIEGRELNHLKFDEIQGELRIGLNYSNNPQKVFFLKSSPWNVGSLWSYNTQQKTLELLESSKLPTWLKNPEFAAKTLWSTSKDGTKVPITIFGKKELFDSKPHKLLLHLYGSYGIEPSMAFDESILYQLLDDSFYAVCHTRGGGFLGQSWHRSGMGENKFKAVEDLLACSETLKAEGFTSKELFSVKARSAGALVLAAALNETADMWNSIVLEAPFLDPIRSLSNPNQLLSVRDREEFGDPTLPSEREWLLKISPILNLKAQKLPAIMISAALEDPLVDIMESITWASKVRVNMPNQRGVFFNLIETASHSGPYETYQFLEEQALQLAFIEYPNQVP